MIHTHEKQCEELPGVARLPSEKKHTPNIGKIDSHSHRNKCLLLITCDQCESCYQENIKIVIVVLLLVETKFITQLEIWHSLCSLF